MRDRQLRLLTVLSGVLLAIAVLWWFTRGPAPELPYDARATVVLWEVDRAAIDAIEIGTRDEALRLEKHADGWRAVRPRSFVADDALVDTIARRLAGAGLAIPTPEVTPEDVGLSPPDHVARFWVGDTERVLEVGMHSVVGVLTYARIPGGPVVAVPGFFNQDVFVPWDGLRDRTVMPFEISKVRGVEVVGRQGTLDLRVEGGECWLEGWGRADCGAVEGLLAALSSLTFHDFLPDAAPDGIADPAFRVTVSLDGGGSTQLAVGDRLPMGLLVLGADGTTGVVDPGRLLILGMGPPDVLDDAAFPIRVELAARIEGHLGGRRFQLDSDGDSWRLLSGSGSAEVVLERLRAVGARWAADRPELGEVWGVVEGRDGPAPCEAPQCRSWRIEIGGLQGDGRLARDVRGGGTYVIDSLDAVLEALD